MLFLEPNTAASTSNREYNMVETLWLNNIRDGFGNSDVYTLQSFKINMITNEFQNNLPHRMDTEPSRR
jgi:hypothetical protein